MNTVGQVERYIEKTKISNAHRYDMYTDEILTIGKGLRPASPNDKVVDAILFGI
mgnify:FL=1